MEDFVRSAVDAGFAAYGVSSHAPLHFPVQWTLSKETVPAYLDEIARLKREYAGKIEIYAGMEIDYIDEANNPASGYFRNLPLDFRIGSIHWVYTPEGRLVDTDTSSENFRNLVNSEFHGDFKRVAGAYFEASMRMVELGGFDFIGHANKIGYNLWTCDPRLRESDWYRSKLADLFALIAEKGLTVEINTKNFPRAGCFYPDVKDWEYIKRWNLPVVVNSDTHRPNLVNAGRPEALQLLRSFGFRTVRQLVQGKWQDVEIAENLK